MRFCASKSRKVRPALRFPIDSKELAWAGGLFDGEGCFPTPKLSGRSVKGGNPVLTMSDYDSVERFQCAVGGLGRISLLKRDHILTKKGLPNKDMWRWYVTSFEETQAVIAMLWSGLNARRKEAAAKILRAHATVSRAYELGGYSKYKAAARAS